MCAISGCEEFGMRVITAKVPVLDDPELLVEVDLTICANHYQVIRDQHPRFHLDPPRPPVRPVLADGQGTARPGSAAALDGYMP